VFVTFSGLKEQERVMKNALGMCLASGLALATTSTSAWAQDWNAEITADNPLHWYRMDETTGTTAIDYGSAALHGTYINGVTLGRTGPVGGAAAFDGVDDVLLMGEFELTQQWTAEFIFFADTSGTGGSQGLMGGFITGLKAEQWFQSGKFGYTEFGVADYTLSANTTTTYSHVVFVNTATNFQLYIDGKFASGNRKTIPLSRDVIGAGNWMQVNPTDPLLGEIDEAVIYDRALSGADIARHFAAIPASCYADCDTSTGAGVLDVFDFLCFQNSFVSGAAYACDCDTSTGAGVCDVFDFLCFQNAFVGGCP
jgi:Concanavalin A-like lectin/glucanases superfamily